MNDKDLSSYIEKADDPAPELEGDVKDNKEEIKETVKPEVPDSSGNVEEDGAEVVKKIQSELGIGDKGENKDEEGTDIPDAFTNACLAQGWTQEEIMEFASDLDDAALLQLIPDLSGQVDSELGTDQAKQEEKSKATEKKPVKEEPTNTEVAALKKELAEIKEELGKAKQERTVKEEQATVQTVNEVFDEVSEEFEIFGKTDELLTYPAGPKRGQYVPTSPAYIARREVVEKALPFIANGMPTKEAMEIGLTWYKGKYLEKDVQRKLIKDLKKHETKLSAKRVGKETVKVYEDEEERKEAVVIEAARKAGVKGAFGV